MPTLQKLKKKKRKKHCSNGSSKLYNLPTYRKLREALKIEMPLCLLCMSEDKITPAEEYHHIKRISAGLTEEEQITLLLDPTNVIGLCTNCHKKIHGLYKISSNKEAEIVYKLQKIRDDYYARRNLETN